MKNLILPFIVISIFAIGSCGDEPVQPTVNNPIDTTEKQDTTDNIVPIKLKELKDIYANIPAIIIDYEYEYSKIVKWDTLKIDYTQLFQPYPIDSVYVSHYDSTDNSYMFIWNTHQWGHAYYEQHILQNDTLSFVVDTKNQKLDNIRYRSYYDVSDNGGRLVQSKNFLLKIQTAPYKIEKGSLVIGVQKGLQNSIEEFTSSKNTGYWRGSRYGYESIGLDTNNQNSSFTMQISLE
ncbi:MAG: hypothetical protein V4642_13885 [Bacteroidota bacterium]